MTDKASVAYARRTRSTDTNDVIVRGDGRAGESAQGDIAAAGGYIKERISADGRVGVAGGVAVERIRTAGRVAGAHCVAVERLITAGHVVVAGGV